MGGMSIRLFSAVLLMSACVACDGEQPAAKPDPAAATSDDKDESKKKEKKEKRPKGKNGRREKGERNRPNRPARERAGRPKRKEKPTGKDKQRRGPQANPDAKADDGSTYTIQLRFHLLKSSEAEIVNTSIDKAGVERLVADVNEVWKQANIHFELEKIVEVQAQNAAAYQELADAWRGAKKAERKKLKKKKGRLMRGTIPSGNRIGKGIDIYMHRYMLGLGGVWGCPHRSVVYAERKPNKRKEMASGSILAHEIGHGLGLPHVPCKKGGNLMMEPCEHRKPDDFGLRKDQIAAARSWASTGGPRKCKRDESDTED